MEEIGIIEENYIYTDANGSSYMLGLFGEQVVKEIVVAWQLPLSENDDAQAGRIRVLKRGRILRLNMDDILYVWQKRRNDAVHGGWIRTTMSSWDLSPTLIYPEWKPETVRARQDELIKVYRQKELGFVNEGGATV